jgi:hypothetical protein
VPLIQSQKSFTFLFCLETAKPGLGVSLKENGRLEEAEHAFQTAIRLNPQDASGAGGSIPQDSLRLEQLSSLGTKGDGNPRAPINWRDIFN